MKKIVLFILVITTTQFAFSQEPKILFFEDFEDNNFANRGWYDNLKGKLTSEEHIAGSSFSLECKFLLGARVPEGGTPGRHLFEETDEVCLSYYVKYSKNYVGSGKPYHPHEFHFITNKDNKWVGPAFTHLTTYTEHNGGYPLLAIQDGENIDQSRVGENLVGISEERGVAGCNGSSDGYPDDCYKSGSVYVNGKMWKAKTKYFSDQTGKYYKNDWHHIESYFKLNSIANGKGITDGIIKYWYDGELIIDKSDVLLRTGEHPDMKFNQFLIAPYIGDGSPVEQTMWIDDLAVSTSRLTPNGVGDKEESKLLISPNPSQGIFYLSYNFLPYTIDIYNMFGQKIYSDKAFINQKTRIIDLSVFPKGIYFVKIDRKNNIVIKSLIIQ